MAVFKLYIGRFVLIPLLAMLCSAAGGRAQDPVHGPVVNSYLLGLDEELGELEFLVKRGEISQSSFARARARLLVTKRYVERGAGKRGEDRVPNLQVLAGDELKALGAGVAPSAAELRVGAVFADRWKLVAIEESQPRFYVFEGLREPLRHPSIDPLSVIETVVVEEKTFTPPPTPASEPPAAEPQAVAAPNISPPPPAAAPALDGPRIIRFYLPSYSREARARGVEGEVVISALFRRDGKIKDIIVEQNLGYGLDERARHAVQRIEFEPARREGIAVDARTQIAFNFRLLRVTVQMRGASAADSTPPDQR